MWQRYSIKESLNRILRLYIGKPVPQDWPGTLAGSVVSEDEALAGLAEALAGSLPGEYFRHAGAQYGELYTFSGTSLMGANNNQWRAVPFATVGLSSSLVTPSAVNNRIALTDVGRYKVSYHVDFIGTPNDVEYAWRPEWNMTGLNNAVCYTKHVSGTFCQAMGWGFIDVTANPAYSNYVNLYLAGQDATGTALIVNAQLLVEKIY